MAVIRLHTVIYIFTTCSRVPNFINKYIFYSVTCVQAACVFTWRFLASCRKGAGWYHHPESHSQFSFGESVVRLVSTHKHGPPQPTPLPPSLPLVAVTHIVQIRSIAVASGFAHFPTSQVLIQCDYRGLHALVTTIYIRVKRTQYIFPCPSSESQLSSICDQQRIQSIHTPTSRTDRGNCNGVGLAVSRLTANFAIATMARQTPKMSLMTRAESFVIEDIQTPWVDTDSTHCRANNPPYWHNRCVIETGANFEC